MVDVAFQSQDLLYVVFLLLLMLCDGEACAAHFFLGYLDLREQVLILTADCLDSVLEALNLLTSIPVVCQDVFFLDLEGAGHLLRPPLLINELLALLLEQVVSVRALSEFLVDKAVLARQRLDVFSHLGDLLSFELRQLSLLLNLLTHISLLLSQCLNLLLSFEEFALIIVFFADCDTHLVLYVAELEALLL